MKVEIKYIYTNDKLPELRTAAGLSQSQLAKAAGLNIRTLQAYERSALNLNGAKLATLLKLCNALDCSLSKLITDPETKEQLEIYEQRTRARA